MVLDVQFRMALSGTMYLRSIRILVVDDSPSDIWLIKEALRLTQWPVQLTIARDGAEAINYFQDRAKQDFDQPDLVLLDLNLPRRNGREVLAEIRSRSDAAQLPVVVLSSSNSEDDMREVYELQASAFMTKPNNLPAYVEMVQGMEKFWLSGLEFRQIA
jgi:two-component system, chemotaxis family, response regulator Rcp1